MSHIFLISDMHLGHPGVCKFLREDGTKLRPWDDVEEMNQVMIDNWNRVVNNRDIVYNLGDVTLDTKYLHILGQLKGRKILVRGNHDTFKLKDYCPYFEDILGVKFFQFGKFKAVLSHIPIHPNHLSSKRVNIHGHLHDKKVLSSEYFGNGGLYDPRYINVSVEQINYTPIRVEQLIEGMNR